MTDPEQTRPRFRPPDAQLPDSASAKRLRPGEAAVYLSWGGQVFGPASPREVLAGLRASSFEKGALFWFEGQPEWRPVAEFPREEQRKPRPRQTANTATADAPEGFWEEDQTGYDPPHRHKRSRKPPRPPGSISNAKYAWVIFFFVLLGAALTVAILWLVMLIPS